MKTNKLFITLFIVVLLFGMFLPTTALAGPTLDLMAWANPEYVVDGDYTTIYIEITNNTGAEVTLTAYGVDNEFYQIGAGTTLAQGASTMIEYEYLVEFGFSDIMSIPVQVNYDDGAGGAVLSFANQVVIKRAIIVITTIDFSATPDLLTVEPGKWVNFTIDCENTGNVLYENFTITTNGADIETFDLIPFEKRTVIFSESYFSDTLQQFGYYFSYTDSNGGNFINHYPAVDINIAIASGPVQTQQPMGTDAPTASPQPSQQPQSTQDNAVTADPQAEPELVSEPQDVATASQPEPVEKGGLSTLAVILIAVGAALFSAGVVLAIVFALRKKSKRSSAL